jgi:unsaturated rhamnogalacturonyl hydrolase
MQRIALLTGILSLICAESIVPQSRAIRTPEQTVRPIIARVMRETSFELKTVEQKPVLDIEVVDFDRLFHSDSNGIAFAASTLWSPADTSFLFGLSFDFPLTIRLNGAVVVVKQTAPSFYFKESGYGLFRFNDTVRFDLKRGRNLLLIKALLRGMRNVCYLREMDAPGKRAVCKFGSPADGKELSDNPWRYCGSFESSSGFASDTLPPELGFSNEYVFRDKSYRWSTLPPNHLQELRIDPKAAYRRESYAEWQYPTGTLMLSLLTYSDAARDSVPSKFVRSYCAFTLDNLPLVRRQYERLHAFRGFDHRLLRQGMLDDAGAPTLPFVELLMQKEDARFDSLVDDMAHYVLRRQIRLSDGTFCRDEPRPGTVWADDLFMSTPLLVRMGMLRRDSAYFDEAALQVVNFHKYLEDKATGLYRHGWYDGMKTQSPISWGRANGWVIWATSEILTYLPAAYKSRNAIVDIYRNHLRAIIRFQAPSGLWHQVLDRADSFEETSCTAMFIIGIARGLRMGILDESFRMPLQKAWLGLQSRISSDGIVSDICRGTEIGNTYDFYARRDRFDNDPRGLGAVITACVEMMRM